MSTDMYDIIKTPLGNLTVIFTDKGVCRIEFRKQNPGEMHRIERREMAPDWTRQFKSYFQGRPVDFGIPLDLREGSSFKQRVWRALQKIPYGETRSYRWVAEQVGKSRAPRAVGRANALNPVPILIPCHRVIRLDGSLGGFSSGVDIKKGLLCLEGALTVA
jgi:O-6-methylguanine DNA methyltransferase